MKKLYYLLVLSASLAVAQPAITNPTPLHACDPDNNGFTTFDLTQKTAEVLGSIDPATVTVAYFETLTDAQNGVNAIMVPTMYTNTSPSNQVVFVGAWNNSGPLNIAVKPLELIADLSPTGTISGPNLVCIGSSVDIVLTGFGGTAPYVFTYSLNGGTAQAIATSGTSDSVTVTLPAIYSTAQVVLLTSQSSAGICSGDVYQNLTINVDTFPVVHIGDYVVYESPTDGIAQFDLNTRTTMLTDNTSGLTVTYYTTNNDAMAGTNPINTAVPFTNTLNPQFVFARVQNGTGCFSVEDFFLQVQDASIIYIPDTFLKAMLTNPDIASSIVSDTPGHHILLDANADGEIEVSEAANAHYIEFPNSDVHSLQGLERFSNLEFISASDNFISTAIDLSNMPNLHHLDVAGDQLLYLNVANSGIQELFCSNNSLSHLDLTTCASLVNLQADTNYLLSSVNVAGLSQLQTLSVYINKIPSLNLSGLTSLQTLDCRSNQISSLDFSGISSLQTINCNTNHLTSIDVSGQPGLQTLACAGNTISSLNLASNPALQILHCNDNHLTTLDCSQNHQLSYLRCYANQLQTLFIKNGSNESFDPANWTENPNLAYICADESQVAALVASVGPATSVNSYCSVPPGDNYNTITGIVHFDGDGNGCDASDITPQFVRLDVTSTDGSGATYTNGSGQYSIFTGIGDTSVSVNFENSNYFDLVLPFTHNFPALDGSVYTQNICLAANGVHPDLEVVVSPVVPARPGFDAVYKIVYKNKGNQTMNDDSPAAINFGFDTDHMTFVQADITPTQTSTGLRGWSLSSLAPFESRAITVVMHVNPPSDPTFPVNVNDVLHFTAQINPVDTDETSADNNFAYNQTVLGSYDPNDIYCLEGAVAPPDEIGEYLHYAVNFENTGTDIAQNITVASEIDPAQYDISSLRVMNSSDDVDIEVNGNKVTFFFRDIKLPIGGHGNILLKMKSKDTLAQGDSVTSKADIFFDYNLPVATNNANTIFQLLGIPGYATDDSVSAYPNPSTGIVNVKADANIKSVQVYDMQGRLLQTSIRTGSEVSVDISGHQSGVYFIKVTSDKGIKVQKIVKK